MATPTQYTYSITAAFPNHAVNSTTLTQEIMASAIITALDHIDTHDDSCDIWFKDSLSSGDKSILDTVVSNHQGIPTPKPVQSMQVVGVTPTAEGRLPTAAAKPVAPKLTFISPNWCDKTTWYAGSARVVGETATAQPDHTSYSLAHPFVIDTYHGKITFEDVLKDSLGNSYRPRVSVNGVVKTEQDPHFASGGDYTINYTTGEITFLAALQPTDVVTATYYYAQSSCFVLAPKAGYRLLIGTVEVQFSDDVSLNDSIVFQAYGLVDVFAPLLMPGVPSGTKIPIGDPLTYKNFADLLNDSNGAYPAYPALGGSNWRALKKAAYLFVWDYTVGLTALESQYGMEIRVCMQHDAPCGGTYGVATFYCTSEAT
jgi:hypothetical protein